MTFLLDYVIDPESAYATASLIFRQATLIGIDGKYDLWKRSSFSSQSALEMTMYVA